MTAMSWTLPREFRFGASSAAHQIEGASAEDGKGPSIWDTFSAEPGRIVDGSTAAVACDHYHRSREDIALMAELGLDGYRFSTAWPRIQPTGRGPVNAAGLDFYDRLVDDLLAHEVAPMLTLYHWDLPQALQDEGGWLNRDTAYRFAEYAGLMADRLADRVAHWIPVNEPNMVTLLGHALGTHAPGAALLFDALPVAHHLNLAHGLAVAELRQRDAASVGTANNHAPIWPASAEEPDVAAGELMDVLWNRLFAEPMLAGAYPEGFGDLLPIEPGDLEAIAAPLDFYGVNHYNPMGVRRAAEGSELPFDYYDLAGYPTSEFGWPVVPDGLREILVLLKERHPDLPPVLITENGTSWSAIDDRFRIDYLDQHLGAIAAAIEAGVDVRGYYTWSLTDNWEWAEGFTQRFGLVHVDYATQVRTPRSSFHWYADTIAAHRRSR